MNKEEFDLHVWKKPETKNMVTTYTISIGQRTICVDMPIAEALRSIREELEDER